MKNRSICLLALLAFSLLAVTPLSGQDFQTGYFLGGYNNAFRLNPAIQGERSFFSLALNHIGAGINSNQLGLDTFLYPVDGELVTAFNDKVPSDKFMKQLNKGGNNLLMNANLDVLTVGFWSGSNFFTVDLRARVDSREKLPYDLFDFMKNGTSSKTTFDLSGAGLSLQGMLEAAVGVSHNFDNRFNVGGRVKFLYGVLSIQTAMDAFTATFSEDRWAFRGRGSLYGSSPALHVSTDENGNIEPDSLTDDIDFRNLLKPAGMGAALDLGATWNVLPWLTLSGAILDLGGLFWNREIYGKLPEAGYEWTGSSINLMNSESDELSEDLDEALDALKKLGNFQLQPSPGAGFSALPVTANLGVEARLPAYPRLSAGVLGTFQYSRFGRWSEGRLSLNWTPFNSLSLSTGTTVNNIFQSIGFALNWHPAAVQFFLGTDYIPTKIVNLENLQIEGTEDLPAFVRSHFGLPVHKMNMNLHFGMSIAIGRRHLDYTRRMVSKSE